MKAPLQHSNRPRWRKLPAGIALGALCLLVQATPSPATTTTQQPVGSAVEREKEILFSEPPLAPASIPLNPETYDPFSSTVVAQQQEQASMTFAAKIPETPTQPEPSQQPLFDEIPFSEPQQYQPNPVSSDPVFLPKRNQALSPFGPPKPRTSTKKLLQISRNQAKQKEDTAEKERVDALAEAILKAASAALEERDARSVHPSLPKATQSAAISPFLRWVETTTDAAAIAKQKAEQYKKQEHAPQENSKETENNDVFLKVRFPYTGAQPTPQTGSAAIYTTPSE